MANLGYNTDFAPVCQNPSGKGFRTKRAERKAILRAERQAKLEGRWVPTKKARKRKRRPVVEEMRWPGEEKQHPRQCEGCSYCDKAA